MELEVRTQRQAHSSIKTKTCTICSNIVLFKLNGIRTFLFSRIRIRFPFRNQGIDLLGFRLIFFLFFIFVWFLLILSLQKDVIINL